jgi:prepilin-type N-terminal cleavage/methylation domain-containing protein/prepilin-type processing-associated H-X9-DG protein
MSPRSTVLLPGRRSPRRGFSLVELLTVIFIIGVLVAILMPALSAAREASRKATCQMHMKQLFIVMSTHADKFAGNLVSGGFDWERDGAVTDTSWVADCVKVGTKPGDLLCPSNPAQISSAYDGLLNGNFAAWTCNYGNPEYHKGSPALTQPDGSTQKNACRAIIEGADRLTQVKKLYAEKYNTNYCASWYLVRTGPILSDTGTLVGAAGCTPDIMAKSGTLGPLNRARSDTAPASSSNIPLLGDGAPGGALSAEIGDLPTGSPMAARMTLGPRVSPSMDWLSSPNPMKDGVGGWWDQWMSTIQDYRSFGPVHGGSCNVLFADGSVRIFHDANGDGQLNNGFSPAMANGFADSSEELKQTEFHSRYSVLAGNR